MVVYAVAAVILSMINLKESIVTTEMGFKSFSAILWLSVLTYSTSTISPIIFYADLRKGRDHIDSHSGITWKEDLYDPQAGSESCDVQGITRIPFSSISSYLVKFTFDNSKPSGYNFHFSNGCGDGWGGTSRCYEVHNYERKVVVHPRKGTGNSTTLNDIITKEIDLKIESGSVKVINGVGMERTVDHSTLFVPGDVYLSMNRVWDLTRYPTPPRVGTGLCTVRIYEYSINQSSNLSIKLDLSPYYGRSSHILHRINQALGCVQY